MKVSEFRTLIREQIRKTLREEEEAKPEHSGKPEQGDVTKISDSPLMDRINNKVEWEQFIDNVIAMEVPSTSTSQKIAILTRKLGELRKTT